MKRVLVVFIIGMIFIVAGVAQVPALQWGNATWYESDFMVMEAAHAFLPFGTRIRITNLENNKRVVVTITKRIPESEDWLLDIAQGAARNLDMIDSESMIPIIIEVIRDRKAAREEQNSLGNR